MDVRAPEGTLRIAADRPASVSVEFDKGVATLEIASNIHYDTCDGSDHYRDVPAVDVKIEGSLWEVTGREYRVAGRIRQRQ